MTVRVLTNGQCELRGSIKSDEPREDAYILMPIGLKEPIGL